MRRARSPRLSPRGAFVDLGSFHPKGFPSRPVRMLVPFGVDPTRAHATLYLFDGQNVFGDEGSYAGGWHADDAVQKIGLRNTWRPVVVGIGNGGVQRIRELGRTPGPFLDAVVRELVPRVEARIHAGGPRVIGGSSLGGLSALRAWLDHPHVFDGAMAMSPSLWFDGGALAREITTGARHLPERGRLYIDAGKREKGRMHADAQALARWLHDHGMPPERLRWRSDPKGVHHERDWGRRLTPALRFLFERTKA